MTAQEQIRVRPAVRADVGAIVGLWQEMMEEHGALDPRFRFAPRASREFERHIQESIRCRESRVLAAEWGGILAGYTLGELHTRKPLYPAGVYGFISDLCVDRPFRRRGIGRALVEELLDWFRQRGATAVELLAAEANPDSRAFWAAMGFSDFLRLMRREIE